MTTKTEARVLIVGGTSGIALATARRIESDGGEVILAGRDAARTEHAARTAGLTARTTTVDLRDESSVHALATTAGRLDAVVSLAADHANGPVGELDPVEVHHAFDAKVVGPLMLAKHLDLAPDAVLVLFSGVVAWRPAPGLSVMAATNAAAASLAESLAVELAPRRVVAVSPGIVDSGAWDGEGKERFLRETAESLPARRIGRPDDLAAAVAFAIDNPFVTGTTLHVDGGGRIA